MHRPWRAVGEWLQPEQTHQSAFEDLLSQDPHFLKSHCFPTMKLGLEVARDLARLQTTLITMVGGPDGEAAHQQLHGHCRIADKLRQSRDAEAEVGADALAESVGQSFAQSSAESVR